MGRFDAFRDEVYAKLDERMNTFAGTVMADAQRRAPARKNGSRRKGTVRTFVPAGSYQFGSVKLTARQIGMAAARAGINLGVSLSVKRKIATAKGVTNFPAAGELQVMTRRPNREHKAVRAFEGRGIGSQAKAMRDGSARIGNGYMDIAVHSFKNRQAQKKQAALRKEARELGQGIHLKDSFTVTNESDGNHIRYSVSAEVRHARFVEFPTSRTAAQPFLLPALMQGKTRMKRALTR